jgi:hypothetical protein
MPLPNEDTTPPVMNTYDVMQCPVQTAAGNNKGSDKSHDRALAGIVPFFQPFPYFRRLPKLVTGMSCLPLRERFCIPSHE